MDRDRRPGWHSLTGWAGRQRRDLDGHVDLDRFAATAARLVDPVNAFFDDVLVMSPDPALRHTRLGLLATVRDLGQQQLDWAELRL